MHHWGGRSVPSTCFHAFPICFPSLFLWFCSLGPQTLLCYYLSPTCLPLLFPVCGGLGTRIFPLLYPLLVSHLSFASVSVLSLKWKTWFVYRWTPPFSHFRLCAAAFGLLFAFQFLWLFPFLHVYGLMAGTNSAPDVSFFCLGSALYNFSYLLLVAGGMECMVPSSFCGCISPLLCLLLLIYALPSFIISLNLYPYVVGTRLVDGRVPLLLFFLLFFFSLGWGGVGW